MGLGKEQEARLQKEKTKTIRTRAADNLRHNKTRHFNGRIQKQRGKLRESRKHGDGKKNTMRHTVYFFLLFHFLFHWFPNPYSLIFLDTVDQPLK